MLGLVKFNKPLSHVTNSVYDWYGKLCNDGTDTKEEAWLKIQRINDCGEIVYRYKDDNEHVVIQYFDMFLEVNNCIGVKIWRNRNKKQCKIDYKKYVKWNKKHGLKSKRKW